MDMDTLAAKVAKLRRKPPRALAGTLGYRIWDCRTAKGMTQIDLSTAAGIGQSAISSLENGESTWAQGSNLLAIAKALDVGVYWLQSGIGDRRQWLPTAGEQAALLEKLNRIPAPLRENILAIIDNAAAPAPLTAPQASEGRGAAAKKVMPAMVVLGPRLPAANEHDASTRTETGALLSLGGIDMNHNGIPDAVEAAPALAAILGALFLYRAYRKWRGGGDAES